MKTVFSNSMTAHVWRFTLGQFTLDRINADGSIKAGCHTIYASQIEHLRALLERKS